jgi:hypothetical protein
MTLVDALNLLTALFSLLAAVITVYVLWKKGKAGRAPAWPRSPWVLVGFCVLLAGVALIWRQVILGPNREVNIATPEREVTVAMKAEGDRLFYVFVATGSCPDCTTDERVQLMVLPPQGGLWVPQRAVTVTNGRWMLNPVYLGDKDNPVRERDTIVLQAVVVQERDSADEQQRLASPLDVEERGASPQQPLTVVKVEQPAGQP